MKYGNVYFMQVTRHVWEYNISDNAKLLFFWLNELEQQFTGTEKDYFYRTDEELAHDMGWSLPTLKKAKAELRKIDLVKLIRVHFRDRETQKIERRWVTGYRILK